MNRTSVRQRLFYDRDDYRLLEIVNRIVVRGKTPSNLRNLYDPELHPRGIKELGAPRALRLATAMIDLLGTLETGTPEARLAALRAVREEAMHQSARNLRLNAARVLLQIMKEIVRSAGDEDRQLALAHDFREASSGKARMIRGHLRAYHLLEMPEEWNQIAFDYHVHDANTKGRKSPTHLIMDAWIKGIRTLEVVYYHLIRPEAAAELLEAAAIMGMTIRIGIEVTARLRDKSVYLMWTPRGFLNHEDFLKFLGEPEVAAFFMQGQHVLDQEKGAVLELLGSFNRLQLPRINERYGLTVPALTEGEFMAYVGTGQTSLIHLAEFAHRTILGYMDARTRELSDRYGNADEQERAQIRETVEDFNRLDSEMLLEEYLRPDMNTSVADPGLLWHDTAAPEAVQMSPSELLNVLEKLPCRSRITLNPSNLSPVEVLEVLHEGRGRITQIEIFNLKDWSRDRTENRRKINDIRLVINEGNFVEANRFVREILTEVESGGDGDRDEVARRLRTILRDLPELIGWYRRNRLRSRIGSDSVGQSRFTRGMGFVVVPTLTGRAQRAIRRDTGRQLPVVGCVERCLTETGKWEVAGSHACREAEYGSGVRMRRRGRLRTVSWSIAHNTTTLASGTGNIAALGGHPVNPDNGLRLRDNATAPPAERPRLGHLNTSLMNALKVLVGFIPAFLTFYLTKDWWLLAYFGAPIWFAITGLRNIFQSLIGGAGIRRSRLLSWSDYVSWGRVSDSLLFTGFSVPLLDYLVKTLLLAHALNITTATHPVMLYTVMALINGTYISSHNTFRGLPPAAIVGNFFRSVLSIPVAIGLNYLVLGILSAAGVPSDAGLAVLQLWAAVISKAASDMVAGFIEGTADRQHNLADRRIDYGEKLSRVFDTYAELETVLPEDDVLTWLEDPRQFVPVLLEKSPGTLRSIIINTLDLLYFWMYQPRARTAFAQTLGLMSPEERTFLERSQRVLEAKRAVSKILLDGLVGKRFERALAFYLSQSDRYLRAFSALTERIR